jgi:hypothetical protein
LHIRQIVNPAIDLDHQAVSQAGEIGDVGADGDLPTVQIQLSQLPP